MNKSPKKKQPSFIVFQLQNNLKAINNDENYKYLPNSFASIQPSSRGQLEDISNKWIRLI